MTKAIHPNNSRKVSKCGLKSETAYSSRNFIFKSLLKNRFILHLFYIWYLSLLLNYLVSIKTAGPIQIVLISYIISAGYSFRKNGRYRAEKLTRYVYPQLGTSIRAPDQCPGVSRTPASRYCSVFERLSAFGNAGLIYESRPEGFSNIKPQLDCLYLFKSTLI